MMDDGRPTEAAPNPAAICPFLRAADGGWRSATAIRDHRCTAVVPPSPLAAEKQRRLCLTASHRSCATFVAAAEARTAVHQERVLHRPVPRSAPIVLDHGRLAAALPTINSKPHIGQGALIGVLGLAFAAVLLARLALGGGPSVPAGGAIFSPTPNPTTGAVASPTTAPTSTPSPEVTPAPTPSAAASPTLVPTEGEATPNPTAEPSHATYSVKSGDTLIAIAGRFGTTVKAITTLNGIKDPSKIRVGQVLQLP